MQVVMVSGGVDSFLASTLEPNSKPIFVDYGQPYAEMERSASRTLYGSKLVSINMEGMLRPTSSDYYVPARNLMLASIGVQFGEQICLAGMRDEQCPDKNPEAFNEMSDILTRHSKKKIWVHSPFWERNKADAINDYQLRKGDPKKLLLTVSCYEGAGKPCNNCEACFRRWVALKVNGISDTEPSEAIIRNYGLRMLHTFNRRRQLTTITALRALGNNVQTLDITSYTNIGDIKPMIVGKYVILHGNHQEPMRNKLRQMLEAERIRYDALVLDTESFNQHWYREPKF